MEFKEYFEFLKFFSKEEQPRYLYLQLDKDGNILDLIDNSRYESIIRELREKGHVRDYYSWQTATLPVQEEERISLNPRKNFRYFQEEREFFSTIPVTTLWVSRADQGRYLGRILFNDLIPNVFTDRYVFLIYVNLQAHTLSGFNRDFYNLLIDRFPSPETLLNAPLAHIFSRFPDITGAPEPSPIPGGNPGLIASIDFGKQGTGTLLKSGGKVTRREEGVLWETGDSGAGLFFPETVDLLKAGFRMDLTFTPMAGSCPLFYFGRKQQDDNIAPDFNGYMAGSHGTEQDHWVVKRKGYIIQCADHPLPASPVTLSLAVHNRNIGLFLNNAPVVSCRDIDFLETDKAGISLALRPGSSVLLKNLAIHSIHTPLAPLEPRDREAVLRHGKSGMVFNLERFYNHTITSIRSMHHLAGYSLYDVSELYERVDSLDSKYRTESRKVRKLEAEVNRYEPLSRPPSLVGSGPRITAVKEWAVKMAQADSTILIEGPTGSGKEVLARFIHDKSGRRTGPFVKVDCATIPQNLLESQLFGYEKGSFTGADARFTGLIERADRGTLFLDEIANMSLSTQTKLLQFLNDFTITRVGGTGTLKINARCIAASNRRLSELIREGAFREDLYYRLTVFQLTLPSLNERREDIRELSSHFLDYFNLLYSKGAKRLSPPAMLKLQEHDWRGNIREFRNVIERAVLFASEEEIGAEVIQFNQADAPGKGPLKKPRLRPERLSLTPPDHVRTLLKTHMGSVAEVVRELGTTAGALYYYFKRHSIDPASYRAGLHGRQPDQA